MELTLTCEILQSRTRRRRKKQDAFPRRFLPCSLAVLQPNSVAFLSRSSCGRHFRVAVLLLDHFAVMTVERKRSRRHLRTYELCLIRRQPGQPIAARLRQRPRDISCLESITIEGNVVTLTHETNEICGVPSSEGIATSRLHISPGHYTLTYADAWLRWKDYVTQSVQFDVLPTGILRVVPCGAGDALILACSASVCGGCVFIAPDHADEAVSPGGNWSVRQRYRSAGRRRSSILSAIR